jgi:hypothetical protein
MFFLIKSFDYYCMRNGDNRLKEGVVQQAQRFGVMAGSVLRMTVLWVNKQ